MSNQSESARALLAFNEHQAAENVSLDAARGETNLNLRAIRDELHADEKASVARDARNRKLRNPRSGIAISTYLMCEKACSLAINSCRHRVVALIPRGQFITGSALISDAQRSDNS